jgi:DNA-binding MarR family transcriptional regulator
MPRSSDTLAAEPYDLSASPSHLLRRVEQLASDRFAQLVGDDLTLRQFTVLSAVAAQPGLSQADLTRSTGIDRSTLADLVVRMERRGWIDRTASLLDARAQSVHLSEVGKQLLVAATQHARAADTAILDALPKTKRKSLLNILVKLTKVAEQKAAKAERKATKRAKLDARSSKRRGGKRTKQTAKS